MKEFIHYEESDFFSTKKDSKQERRRATSRDRSKFKKTDLQKTKTETAPEGKTTFGVVTSVRGQEIFVDTGKKQLTCTLRGLFKKIPERLKNPIVVGDRVLVDDDSSIQKIEPRYSTLSRGDNLSHKKEHLIAANIDQVLITVSLVDPPLRPTLIDRFLIAALKGNMHPIILCNKVDLLENEECQQELLEECQAIYHDLHIPFLALSTKTGQGIEELRHLMKNRTSVFLGQSGAGKSSLLNAVAGFDLKVGRTVQASKKGAHTTSHASLMKLPFGGYVVDTPGIKSFGLWDIKKEEIKDFFSDLLEVAKNCKFQDCLHQGEEGCAVPDALEKGLISPLRYESYLNLFSSLESEHFRR